MAAVLAGLVVLAVAVAWLADEPLRRSMEREINRRLQGYVVRIERLDGGWVAAALHVRQRR